MENQVNQLLDTYENGKMNRRQLVARLGALVAGLGSSSAFAQEKQTNTFQATEVNHVALRVTNVQRSRNFYSKHLGLKVSRQTENNCFLTCGKNFLALFKGDTPRMDHFCFAVKDYAVLTAEEKLRAQGIEPQVVRNAGRIYFPDPDGLKVQLAAETHRP